MKTNYIIGTGILVLAILAGAVLISQVSGSESGGGRLPVVEPLTLKLESGGSCGDTPSTASFGVCEASFLATNAGSGQSNVSCELAKRIAEQEAAALNSADLAASACPCETAIGQGHVASFNVQCTSVTHPETGVTTHTVTLMRTDVKQCHDGTGSDPVETSDCSCIPPQEGCATGWVQTSYACQAQSSGFCGGSCSYQCLNGQGQVIKTSESLFCALGSLTIV